MTSTASPNLPSHPATAPLDAAATAAAAAAASPSLRNLLPRLQPRRRPPPPTNPIPVPKTPALPPQLPSTTTTTTTTTTGETKSGDDESFPGWEFRLPTRRILSARDHELFLASPARDAVVAWILGLADAVVDTPCPPSNRRWRRCDEYGAVKEGEEEISDNDSDNVADIPAVRTLLDILDEAESLTRLAPPVEQGGSRFGNKAFRGFLDLIHARSPAWHRRLGLHVDDSDSVSNPNSNNTVTTAAAEASVYLAQSFGDMKRIDYGSGHELNFAIWLLCLYRLRVFQTPSSSSSSSSNQTPLLRALALRVYARYLVLMRTVQTLYYLEPAGSHGVWGLDDYQFLPFLLGAAQLRHHRYITPRAVRDDDDGSSAAAANGNLLSTDADDYLYLGQVRFVAATKSVRGLRWHSPMLDDISAARDWARIDDGMRRLFVADVLGSLPVMQHFLFGSLVPAAEGMSGPDDGGDDEDGGGAGRHVGHRHDGKGWDDCCGIKVPSSIAAAQEMKKATRGAPPLRRIPFD